MNIFDIKSPSDIYNLSIDELETLAKDIRKFLIEIVSKNGGHLGGNLGIVELTIALHHYFRNGEKFIFDVSHQSYTHKILTGRANEFVNLRKHNGLAGFQSREESIYDFWEVAHTGTSIAALIGLIESGKKGVAIIGDGALTNGESFESLELLSTLKKNAIVIINDNNFSISKNVGALTKIFDSLRSTKGYKILADKNRNNTFLKNIKNSIKSIFYKPNIFDDMGFKYYGPIDGYNFKELFKYFKYAEGQDRPVILHVVTKKGKGYKYAEEDKIGKWHSVTPFDLESGKTNDLKEGHTTFISACSEYINKYYDINKNTKLIIPAMTFSSSMDSIRDKMKDDFIDTGITESLAMSLSSSFALNNIKVFIPVYSTFLQRAYDQIHQDVVMQDSPVTLIVDKAGINPGNGKTHQGIYDISYLETIPNLTILAPKDKIELFEILKFTDSYKHPVAIHISAEAILNPSIELKDIKDIDLRWNKELNLNAPSKYVISYSSSVNYIKDTLKELNIELINAKSIRPLDFEMLNELIISNKPIYVYEDAPSETSLYSYILNYFNKLNKPFKLIPLGFPLDYIDIGTIEELRKDYKLDKESIKELLK